MQPEATIKYSKKKPNLSHTIFGALITGYLLLLFLLYRVNTPIIVSAVTFDFLFVSLIFPLRGPLVSKTILLLTGNLTGFAWNLMQFQLTEATAYFLGDVFSVISTLVSPFFNLVWIVSFWALGLSILSREHIEIEEARKN